MLSLIKGKHPFNRIEDTERYFAGNAGDYEAFREKHKLTPVLFLHVTYRAGEIAYQFGAAGCFMRPKDQRDPFDEIKLIRAVKHYVPK